MVQKPHIEIVRSEPTLFEQAAEDVHRIVAVGVLLTELQQGKATCLCLGNAGSSNIDSGLTRMDHRIVLQGPFDGLGESQTPTRHLSFGRSLG